MSEVEQDIIEVLNGSGLPPSPEPPAPEDFMPSATRSAVEVVGAIEQACETTIKRMYEAVELNEALVKDQRQKVDDFATQLRAYYKAHLSSISDFMAHLQKTTNEIDQHVGSYAEKIQAEKYPRAGDD